MYYQIWSSCLISCSKLELSEETQQLRQMIIISSYPFQQQIKPLNTQSFSRRKLDVSFRDGNQMQPNYISFLLTNVIISFHSMGGLQAKIKDGYSIKQKPFLKKKSQKGAKPISESKCIIQNIRQIDLIQAPQIQLQKKVSIEQQSTTEVIDYKSERSLSSQLISYPFSAIGLIKIKIDGQVKYSTGSLIHNNIVITTPNNLFSHKNKCMCQDIRFILGFGGNQTQQFQVERVFFPEQYKNLNFLEKNDHEKAIEFCYALIILKSHVDIKKSGFLGFDFNQESEEKTSQVVALGYSSVNNAIIRQQKTTKAKIAERYLKFARDLPFSIDGGPIIEKCDQQWTIIGLQTHSSSQILQNHKYLRLNQYIFNKIGEWITQQQQQIDLRDKNIGPEGLKKMAKLKWTSIHSINISRNNFGSEGLKYLTRCEWNNLYHLDIGGNNIGVEGVKHIVEVQIKHLQTLNLWGNQIGSQGAAILVNGDWMELSSLNLYNNNICNDGIKCILNANWKNLENINLGKNNINAGIVPFFQHSNWKNIITLNIWGNSINKEKFNSSEIKKYFSKLKYLYL